MRFTARACGQRTRIERIATKRSEESFVNIDKRDEGPRDECDVGTHMFSRTAVRTGVLLANSGDATKHYEDPLRESIVRENSIEREPFSRFSERPARVVIGAGQYVTRMRVNVKRQLDVAVNIILDRIEKRRNNVEDKEEHRRGRRYMRVCA